jgi:hypothetical protein
VSRNGGDVQKRRRSYVYINEPALNLNSPSPFETVAYLFDSEIRDKAE